MGLQMEVQLTPNGKLSGHSGAICTNVHLLPFHHLIDQQDEIQRVLQNILPLKLKFKEYNTPQFKEYNHFGQSQEKSCHLTPSTCSKIKRTQQSTNKKMCD